MNQNTLADDMQPKVTNIEYIDIEAFLEKVNTKSIENFHHPINDGFQNDSSSESENKSLSVQLFSKISSKSSILSHVLHEKA